MTKGQIQGIGRNVAFYLFIGALRLNTLRGVLTNHCDKLDIPICNLQQFLSSCPHRQSLFPSQICACEMHCWFPQCTSPLRLHTRQLSSSERSAQSTCPSQRQSCGMQRFTSHWKPFGHTGRGQSHIAVKVLVMNWSVVLELKIPILYLTDSVCERN